MQHGTAFGVMAKAHHAHVVLSVYGQMTQCLRKIVRVDKDRSPVHFSKHRCHIAVKIQVSVQIHQRFSRRHRLQQIFQNNGGQRPVIFHRATVALGCLQCGAAVFKEPEGHKAHLRQVQIFQNTQRWRVQTNDIDRLFPAVFLQGVQHGEAFRQIIAVKICTKILHG